MERDEVRWLKPFREAALKRAPELAFIPASPLLKQGAKGEPAKAG